MKRFLPHAALLCFDLIIGWCLGIRSADKFVIHQSGYNRVMLNKRTGETWNLSGNIWWKNTLEQTRPPVAKAPNAFDVAERRLSVEGMFDDLIPETNRARSK